MYVRKGSVSIRLSTVGNGADWVGRGFNGLIHELTIQATSAMAVTELLNVYRESDTGNAIFTISPSTLKTTYYLRSAVHGSTGAAYSSGGRAELTIGGASSGEFERLRFSITGSSSSAGNVINATVGVI